VSTPDTAIDYRIATSVLEAIAKGALQGDHRLRFHHGLVRSGGADISVEHGECRVKLSLEARLGEDLLALGAEVQRRVAAALTHTTGLPVEGVTVVFAGVFPPEAE